MINQTSPFSGFIDFFRPIYARIDAEDTYEGENFACLRESINIFDFGQRGFTLLYSEEDNSLILLEREGSNQSWSEIAWRVVKIATIIIPLIKLIGATIYFLANDFQLQAPQDVLAKGVKVKKAKTSILESLNDDLIMLFFKYLGPACFQLASTNSKAYALMNEDPSLEKYRIGREALKQCFSSEFMRYKYALFRIPSSLVKALCAYDLEAAFKRANSNTNLKYRVYDLVVVSEAFAEFNEKKSLEILDYAYKEVNALGQRVKSLLGNIINPDMLGCYDRMAALARLAKGFVKRSDMDNKILVEVQELDLPSWHVGDYELKKDMEVCALLHSIGDCNAETMEREKANISWKIDCIRDLGLILPEVARFLVEERVEDLFEFLNKFINKFPEAGRERVCLLLDLSELLVEFNLERACELAEEAIREAELIEFNPIDKIRFHTKYVKILSKHGQIEAIEATKLVPVVINLIEQDLDLFWQIPTILDFLNAITPFNGEVAKELAEKVLEKIKDGFPENRRLLDLGLYEGDSYVSKSAARAAEFFASYNQEQAFEMLNLAVEKHTSYDLYYDHLFSAFEALAKVNPKQTKEIVEDLKDPFVKFIALISLVMGVTEK